MGTARFIYIELDGVGYDAIASAFGLLRKQLGAERASDAASAALSQTSGTELAALPARPANPPPLPETSGATRMAPEPQPARRQGTLPGGGTEAKSPAKQPGSRRHHMANWTPERREQFSQKMREVHERKRAEIHATRHIEEPIDHTARPRFSDDSEPINPNVNGRAARITHAEVKTPADIAAD